MEEIRVFAKELAEKCGISVENNQLNADFFKKLLRATCGTVMDVFPTFPQNEADAIDGIIGYVSGLLSVDLTARLRGRDIADGDGESIMQLLRIFDRLYSCISDGNETQDGLSSSTSLPLPDENHDPLPRPSKSVLYDPRLRIARELRLRKRSDPTKSSTNVTKNHKSPVSKRSQLSELDSINRRVFNSNKNDAMMKLLKNELDIMRKSQGPKMMKVDFQGKSTHAFGLRHEQLAVKRAKTLLENQRKLAVSREAQREFLKEENDRLKAKARLEADHNQAMYREKLLDALSEKRKEAIVEFREQTKGLFQYHERQSVVNKIKQLERN